MWGFSIPEINFLLVGLLGGFTIFSIGFYVFLKDPKRELNRVFFLLTFSGTIWGIGKGLWQLYGATTYHSYIYFRLFWGAVAFLGPTFLHTTILLYKKKRKIPLGLLYFPAFVMFIFVFTPYFINPVFQPGVGTFFVPAPGFYLGFTIFFLIYLLLGEVLLLKKYFLLRSFKERRKIGYYFVGSLIPVIGAGITYVFTPLWGFYTKAPLLVLYIIKTNGGFISFIVGFLIAAYAITSKRLFVNYREILEIIFQRLTELVLVIDRKGIIIFIGENTLSKLGYQRKEVENAPLSKLLVGRERKQEEILRILKRKTEVVERDINFLSKRGQIIPFSVSFFPQKDETIITGKDIREFLKESKLLEKRVKERTRDLKNTQRALMNILEDVEEARSRALEEKKRVLAIIKNFTDGLIVLDKKGNITIVNPWVEKMFKLKGQEVRGGNVRILKRNRFLLPATKLILDKGQIKEVKREIFSPQKGTTIEITTVPLKSKGVRRGYLLIFHDVSREKVVERMKTEFVSISAHQLRTPLSAIKWSLKMILDGDVGKITEEQRKFLEKTYRSNERMIHLVNDLLDVARIEEGRFLYNLTSINLKILVLSVIKFFKEEAGKKKIKIEFKETKERIPLVKVDAEKIRLAIRNLLENAVRYTQPGGEIIISLKLKGKELEFSIKDTGVGIPKDQQKRVFTKFFRGANIMQMETEGTGLGLFITKNIIESHGGKIWFKSIEGKGTTFYFTLPIRR